jgi:hypothetical protein
MCTNSIIDLNQLKTIKTIAQHITTHKVYYNRLMINKTIAPRTYIELSTHCTRELQGFNNHDKNIKQIGFGTKNIPCHLGEQNDSLFFVLGIKNHCLEKVKFL